MEDTFQEIQVACFRLGCDTYAVDIMRIKEIIRPQKLVVLPKSPSSVEGIINLRGNVVPILDLRKRFDLPTGTDEHLSRLLIVTIARRLVGLVVDEMIGVVTLPTKDLKPPPMVMEGVNAEYLIGVCLLGESLVMLLNLDTLLSGLETHELNRIANDVTLSPALT
jgi:purine-binding chemotaxis protein CheW